VGVIRAYAQGTPDLVFIGSAKNVLLQSIVAGAEIKRPEDLKGKRIGVTRIGGNTHYFTVQGLRCFGLDPDRDIVFIPTGANSKPWRRSRRDKRLPQRKTTSLFKLEDRTLRKPLPMKKSV
jgi:hypothetical protein